MSISSVKLWDSLIADCCKEPFNAPGTVQWFGALVVTDQALETITHVSANLLQVLGLAPEMLMHDEAATTEDSEAESQAIEPEDAEDADNPRNQQSGWDGTGVLGHSLETVLSPDLIHDIANVCGLPWVSSQREQVGIYELNGRSFNVCVHLQGNQSLIELEPLPQTIERSSSVVTRLKLLLEGEQDYKIVLSRCAEELRHETGFDRVMVYQFLHDGCGEVIAEDRCDDMESFLHLRFPATDIPELSRQILCKTRLRLIPDINAALVPLLAIEDADNPLDLSLATIRGTSLVHSQEYLPNMGIESSMTLAIVIEGELWGLFAFHHRHPKLLSPAFRSAIDLCGLLLSLYLQQQLTKEAFNHQRQAADFLTQLFSQRISTDEDWQTLGMHSSALLCELMSADGLAFTDDQQVLSVHGDVPEEASILSFVADNRTQADQDVLAIDNLSQLSLSEENSYIDWGTSAGALLLFVDLNGPHYLLFFRNETITEVQWAGNPTVQRIVPVEDSSDVLRPQRSFDAYKQLVQGYCHPWSERECSLARDLRHALGAQVVVQERQSLLIAELKHRVKNILALIRSVARQTSRSKTSIDQYIQELERRIAALAMAHELVTRRELLWPRLYDLLEVELRPYLSIDINTPKSPQVTLTGPEVMLNASFVPTFILVLHELVSNAVKYGALSVPEGKLAVRWFKERKGLTILWREAEGPEVTSPEDQERGFGCELIERAIPYEFNGKSNLCFAPSGVEGNFWFPSTLIRWETESKASQSISPQSSSKKPTAVLSPPKPVLAKAPRGAALLVEDNMLIAIEMERQLKEQGFARVDSAPTVERATDLLTDNTKKYSLCLLDINLKTETSFDIAYLLLEKKIPFTFATGYDSKHPVPENLKSIPLLKKPIDSDKLHDMILNLLGQT